MGFVSPFPPELLPEPLLLELLLEPLLPPELLPPVPVPAGPAELPVLLLLIAFCFGAGA